jgi:alpha-amylase
MGVMLQAFYWDCPKIANREFGWWDHVREKLPGLREAGFPALWLPPCSKAASNTSMGYDPFDLFDLGEHDQCGGKETWYGSRAALEGLIREAHRLGFQAIADAVYNHNSGGELELNPDFKTQDYTLFRPKSGIFPRDYRCYHPSRFERRDREAFGGMPDLCHRNPYVYQHILKHAEMLVGEVGFDGFRFDFVKGYSTWMIKAILETQYPRDGKLSHLFGVGESWTSDTEIDAWLDAANHLSDNPICAFDFPLRYRLKDLCDSYGFSLRELVAPGVLYVDRPRLAVTFVDNHDFRGGDCPPIINDKMLAYAFILTHEGYPCVFWQDYYEHGLGLPGEPSGIAALTRAHESHAGGPTVVRYLDDNLYIMERLGADGACRQPGLIFVLNNRGDGWHGAAVQTAKPRTRFTPAAWRGKDLGHPQEVQTGSDGRAEFWAPPRGYAVYVPAAG